jgi:uncharacterized protein (TIGR03437 family)
MRILCLLTLTAIAFAQSPSFTGFTQGNLVVSRTTYSGTAASVTVGQPLPPVCPVTASCGTAKAASNGAYPSAGSTDNVFANNTVDGSFGITTPILLDQMTPSGTVINTLAVPTNLLVTSFSSKSELALNLSADGTAITFMGYMAPVNTLDVSNSNTPGVYDPTNPVGTSYFRAVAQVSGTGAIQITPTNAYSGNNGRAAVLAGGQYYMAGNSNNGGGTPTNVITATGAQIATPGQAASTVPKQIGYFSITQINDPSTGKPYAADKAGKDNNFRGLTQFNNTIYMTKGSGGNGVNTVYQMGTAGTLPTLANAATAAITILPGFPTTLAKNADAMNPFGIFFANATTLYVADEGDGTMANAAKSANAGLQKWVLTGGTWQRVYVLQNGLNLGQQYSVANYPASIIPATDGIRNIAGRVNGDGTVTIWGVTSTVSANGDQGADPNKLVMITDVLSATTASAAASESFTTVRSAVAGEVLRGVALAPSGGSAPAVPSIVSAATPGVIGVSSGEIASMNGQALATGDPIALSPLQNSYNGVSISIADAAGNTSIAPLQYVSATQINFLIPNSVAPGSATVTLTNLSGTQVINNVVVSPVAPSLFVLNNSGLAAAQALRVSAGGTQTPISVYATNAAGAVVPSPISLGSATDQVYLSLYGTGIANAGTGGVTVTIAGVKVPVFYAGPQTAIPGLDQVNVLIPSSLAGKGYVNVQLTAGGVASNPVQITLQ